MGTSPHGFDENFIMTRADQIASDLSVALTLLGNPIALPVSCSIIDSFPW
jgi:hypothetical protein